MAKEYLKNSWRKLDNTAKIFSLDDIKNTNTFRYSVVLKEDVDEEILREALKKALSLYSLFKVKIGTGLFWNYLEFNHKEPIIKKDNEIACKYINFKKNNDYLFEVSYYKKKINLDIFHVLTDGTGAMKFLKSIIYNYLDLKNGLLTHESSDNDNTIYQDYYLKYYDKNLKENMNFKSAYLIPGKTNKNVNNTYHYIMDVKDLKNVCKIYNVTITEYLTVVYIYAMYLSFYNKNTGKEIVVTVPINLRKYYQVDTLSNFFVCMDVNPKIVEKNLMTFDEILREVHKEFQEKLKIDEVKKYLARDVKLGMNITIRLIPLFIKKIFIKYIGHLVIKSSTSTLSNVGIIDIDDKYKKYIDNILVLVTPNKTQKIKCTICSFGHKINVTMNSCIDDLKFEQTFLKLLQERISNIEVQSNNRIDLKKIESEK